MKVWTVLKILVFIALLLAVGLLTVMNSELLKEDFVLVKETSFGNFAVNDVSPPLFVVLVGTFVLGLLVSVVFIGLQEIELFFENMRRKSREKRVAAIEELYFTGIEAVFDGRKEEAVNAFYKLLEEDPKHLQARIKLGQVLRKLGRYDEAIKIHKLALKDAPDNHRVLYDLANDYKMSNNLEKAREILLKITEGKPKTSLNAHRCLRDIYCDDNNWEQALEVQERIIKFTRGSKGEKEERNILVSILYRQGKHLRENGDYKLAGKLFKKVLKQDSDFVPAYLELGQTCLDEGEPDDAVKVWKDGLSKTMSPVFLARIEKHYMDAEQPTRAIDVFQDIISRTQAVVIPRFLLGKLYLRLEMMDEAERQFSEVASKVEYSPTLNYFMGKILERRGKYEEAAGNYRTVIKSLGILNLQYICRTCNTNYGEWKDHCSECDSWNSVEIDLTEEASLKELSSPEMLSTP